jgi:hypothetical protein
MMEARKKKEFKTIVVGFSIAFLIVAFLYCALLWRTGLPSDEEMIAHFYAHRADIEELVRRFRNFEMPEKDDSLPKNAYQWDKQPGTPELMKRARVWNITGFGPMWLPDPYSTEAVKEIEKIYKYLPARRRIFLRERKYGAIKIRRNPKERFFRGHPIYLNIWKNLIFFPEIPRIEDGWLLGPVRTNGRHAYRNRTSYSLNYFPKHWEEYECVYRPIEPHWFLQLCNGH